MPPTIVLIRHAQALHNEYHIPDPELSEKGVLQCRELGEDLAKTFEHVQARDAAIIVSPMRRTIQTALLSLGWLIKKGVRMQADARWQENSAKPCDTGSPVEALVKEYPMVDYSTLDPVFPDKTSPAGAQYAYTRTAILGRGQSCLESLRNRPEKYVFVVSHSGFLRLGLTGFWFANGDYRVFDIQDSAGASSPLVQSLSTAAGGLGKSRTEPVELGSELPEEGEETPPN